MHSRFERCDKSEAVQQRDHGRGLATRNDQRIDRGEFTFRLHLKSARPVRFERPDVFDDVPLKRQDADDRAGHRRA
jgi:hypothetical protein